MYMFHCETLENVVSGPKSTIWAKSQEIEKIQKKSKIFKNFQMRLFCAEDTKTIFEARIAVYTLIRHIFKIKKKLKFLNFVSKNYFFL